ncbi:MAG: serine/threonine protein phosphatase [Flavobacteriia bacterium]|nr:serine/threonine protein phosphatase [Flavobacteriia bacterium]
MNVFVFGDIHGGYKALVALIKKLEPGTDDQLIFLGDYVDGWSQAVETIDYLMELDSRFNCVFLKGNHDALALDWLENGQANPQWLDHGGRATVASYQGLSAALKAEHIRFYKALKSYYIDAQNRLFVHAGFSNQKGVAFEYFEKTFYWDRTLWETALSLDPGLEVSSALYPKRFRLYKEVFIGHTPVSRIGETVPVLKANIWNIDTAAAFRGPLTAMEIHSKQFWQSGPVCEYYPQELGRNPA